MLIPRQQNLWTITKTCREAGFCCAPLASRFVPINSAEAAPPLKAEFDVCYLNRMATRLFRQDVSESFQRGGIFIFRVQAYIGT